MNILPNLLNCTLLKNYLVTFCLISLSIPAAAQDSGLLATAADTMRGSITPQRAWWDVVFYDLHVTVQPEDSSIAGYNNITYRPVDTPKLMQIDLQDPLQIDQIKQGGKTLSYHRVEDSYAYMVEVPKDLKQDSLYTISVYYQGKPKVAENAPWDGGFVWAEDSLGNDWIATANQGLGASVWWPNKDHQTAEPDSMSINITVPDEIKNVSNGRLRDTTRHDNGMTTWSWFVSNPINNYNVAVNAGNYVNFTDTYEGKKGTLDLSYWVLEYNLDEAKEQFKQVKPMLRCFEDWFGAYPFYEDSFKLVETPHLGMEHQSAIAYGNEYQNGYRGTDLSGSGWGLKWDFIIIHESGHEWWGNSITTRDVADMWVHEGFTSYSESIYTECRFGEEAAAEYTRGLRKNIANEYPLIEKYGINKETRAGVDMYYKGHNLLHTIRQIIDNDSTWKNILRGLQKDFRHQIVTSKIVENYINEHTDYDLRPVFDQYLRHADIPVFEYSIENGTLRYRWNADVKGFDMPIRVTLDEETYSFIQPTTEKWKQAELSLENPDSFKVDKNFYIKTDSVETSNPSGNSEN